MDYAQLVWLVTVVLTGTAAGAMVGHTVLLGRFLNWMFESGKNRGVQGHLSCLHPGEEPADPL